MALRAWEAPRSNPSLWCELDVCVWEVQLLHSERCWILCGMPGVFGVLHWLIQYLLEAKAPFAGVWLYPCGVYVLCLCLGWTNVGGRFWFSGSSGESKAWLLTGLEPHDSSGKTNSCHFGSYIFLAPLGIRFSLNEKLKYASWILPFPKLHFSSVKVWVLLPQPRGCN